jgi:hypothetical protein
MQHLPKSSGKTLAMLSKKSGKTLTMDPFFMALLLAQKRIISQLKYELRSLGIESQEAGVGNKHPPFSREVSSTLWKRRICEPSLMPSSSCMYLVTLEGNLSKYG